MYTRVFVGAVLLLAACAKESKKAPRVDACEGGKREKTGAIEWYEDDVAKAMACAKQEKLPLVIDGWAPWCHTCLSMKTIVFADPAFAELAPRFVWLAADTDKEANAPLVEKYQQTVWPTYWVVDAEGAVKGRYVGAASVDQFREFLTHSERTFLAGEKLDPKSADGQLVAAERAVAEAARLDRKDPKRIETLAAAADAYEAALAAAPRDWPRRPDVLVSAIGVISRFANPDDCLGFALAHVDETGRSSSVTDYIWAASGCANRMAEIDPKAADEARATLVARLEGLLGAADAQLSPDDRSDAMMCLRELYEDLGRPQDAVAIAEKARALLDEAAKNAKTPTEAMTYNWPRSEVYAFLKKHDELIPALEKSAADLPEEYDPPYRIAWLYKDAGKLEPALEWARKSAALAYGPRKARVLSMIADILRLQGDTQGELAARRELVALYKSLPAAQLRRDELEQAEIDLAALEAVAQGGN